MEFLKRLIFGIDLIIFAELSGELSSIMITSNLTFSQWQGVLNNDEALTAAIMDRLIHHSHIVNINGDSYRLKQKRKAGIIPVKMKSN